MITKIQSSAALLCTSCTALLPLARPLHTLCTPAHPRTPPAQPLSPARVRGRPPVRCHGRVLRPTPPTTSLPKAPLHRTPAPHPARCDAHLNTCVHYAALEAREAALVRLLASPATHPALSHRNADELTPLHQSAGTGDARCVTALLQADSSVVDERVREEVPRCHATHASLRPHAPSLRRRVPSLRPYASQGTSTHIACEKGHAEALRQILSHGADIEAHVSPLEDPRTPLHLAAEYATPTGSRNPDPAP